MLKDERNGQLLRSDKSKSVCLPEIQLIKLQCFLVQLSVDFMRSIVGFPVGYNFTFDIEFKEALLSEIFNIDQISCSSSLFEALI